MVEEKPEEGADKKKEGDKDKSSGDAGKDKTAGAPSAAGVVDEQSELQKKAKEYLEAKSGQGCMGSSVELIRFGRISSNLT